MNIKKISFLMLMVMGIVLFSTYPSTSAKYITDKKNYLKYSSNFVKVPTDNTIKKMAASGGDATATFTYTFSRNNSAIGLNESYSVIVNGCNTTINKIARSTIEFTSDDDAKDIRVDVTCSINYAINGHIGKDIVITEKIGDSTPFRYLQLRGDYTFPVKSIVLNDLKSDKDINSIKAYLNSGDIGNLKGITVSGSSYTLDDNFKGYANTYVQNKDITKKNVMMFSTNDAAKIEEASIYYLEEYYMKNDASNLEVVKDYLSFNGGISAVINDGKVIRGILFQDGKIILDDSIIEYALRSKEVKSEIIDTEFRGYILKNDLLFKVEKTADNMVLDFYPIVILSEENKISGEIVLDSTFNQEDVSELLDYLTIYANLGENAKQEYTISEDGSKLVFNVIKEEAEVPGDIDNPTISEEPGEENVEGPITPEITEGSENPGIDTSISEETDKEKLDASATFDEEAKEEA